MLYQALANVTFATLDQAEYTRVNTTFLDRGVNRLGNDFAGTRMGRVTLDHDRATSSQCRCGITTRDREGQREVGRTKHSNRANRTLHQTQVRARQRRTIRKSFVITTIQIFAIKNVAGKQAKLTDGTAALTLKARFGQAGFLGADFGDFIATRVDFIRNRVDEFCALFAG